jgi:hypothetical protein
MVPTARREKLGFFTAFADLDPGRSRQQILEKTRMIIVYVKELFAYTALGRNALY